MKWFSVFAVVCALLALLGGAHAAPSPNPKIPVKQIGKAIKTGLGVIGAAGTAHEVYQNVKNRG